MQVVRRASNAAERHPNWGGCGVTGRDLGERDGDSVRLRRYARDRLPEACLATAPSGPLSYPPTFTMSSAVYPSHPTAGSGPSSSRSNYYRPATIAELAAQAQENLWDPSKGLKHWLRTAEKSRRTAEALLQSKDYEGAFVEFAKDNTIVLEKLPTHREYKTLLNADQRHNLGMVSLSSSSMLWLWMCPPSCPYAFIPSSGGLS